MANWIKGEEVRFQGKYSPVLIIGSYDDGMYELTLEGGWEDSSSVKITKEELLKVIESLQKFI
ncbi:hypothetical protein [Paenibacillus taichungensis]